MANRGSISKEQLAAWMTKELQKFEGCEECEVHQPYELREPDAEGCNWSLSSIRATGVPKEVYGPALDKVVSEARTKFNIE
ncbi:MAG TPA: hypothetical protein VGK77_00205 [Candidatus Binatia bacterium]|jgi:hypothetical protein